MALSGFNNQFNRFRLVVKNGGAEEYAVSWGGDPSVHRAATRRKLISWRVKDAVRRRLPPGRWAVAKSEPYETKQIKSLFHGEEGAADMEATVSLTEKARAPLAAAIANAMVPVTHTVTIQPNPEPGALLAGSPI